MMDLGVTLGLFGVLIVTAGFLCYYISGALNFEDAKRVDKKPNNDIEQ